MPRGEWAGIRRNWGRCFKRRGVEVGTDLFSVESIYSKYCSGTTRTGFNVFSYWAVVLAGFSGVLIARMIGSHPNAVLRTAGIGKTDSAGVPFPISFDGEGG